MSDQVNRGEYRKYFPFIDDDGNVQLNAQEGVSLGEQTFKHRIISQSCSNTLRKISHECPQDVGGLLKALSLLNGGVSLDSKRMPRNFTIRDSGEISYLPRGKDSQVLPQSRVWRREGREITQRYGAHFIKPLWAHVRLLVSKGIIRKDELPDYLWPYLTEPLPSYLVEETHNFLYSKLSYHILGDFKEVGGEDIRHYYLNSSYDWSSNLGSLGESCMRYPDSQISNSLDLYVENPESVGLLILASPDDPYLIVGRALIWRDVLVDGEKHTLLDRIYSSDKAVHAFKQYASDKGWLYKTYQNYDSTDCVTLPGGISDCVQVITSEMIVSRPNRLPFLDTMAYVAEANFRDQQDHRKGALVVFSNLNGDPFQSIPQEYVGYMREKDEDTALFSNSTPWWKGLLGEKGEATPEEVASHIMSEFGREELDSRIDYGVAFCLAHLMVVSPFLAKRAITETLRQKGISNPYIPLSAWAEFLNMSLDSAFIWSELPEGPPFWFAVSRVGRALMSASPFLSLSVSESEFIEEVSDRLEKSATLNQKEGLEIQRLFSEMGINEPVLTFNS